VQTIKPIKLWQIEIETGRNGISHLVIGMTTKIVSDVTMRMNRTTHLPKTADIVDAIPARSSPAMEVGKAVMSDREVPVAMVTSETTLTQAGLEVRAIAIPVLDHSLTVAALLDIQISAVTTVPVVVPEIYMTVIMKGRIAAVMKIGQAV
jgi:hypothetical protein